jgi:hypothetical protein
VTIQLGNLASFFYAFLVQHHVPSRLTFIPIIIVLTIAPLVGLSIALLWHTTTLIRGTVHSVALSSLAAASGLVGALSTVTIFPWASLYGATMVAAVSTGSGANGLVAAILAVIQNPASPEPHFPLHVYFFILTGVLFMSIIAFIIIQLVRGFEKLKTPNIASSIINDKHSLFSAPHLDDDDYLTPQITDSFKKNYSSTAFAPVNGSVGDYKSLSSDIGFSSGPEARTSTDSERQHLLYSEDYLDDNIIGSSPYQPHSSSETQIPTASLMWHVRAPIMYQFYINVLYYLLLGLIPFAYSKMQYERSSKFVFWTNIVGMILNSVGRLVTFKWRLYFPRTFSILQTPFFIFVFVMCFVQKHHIPEALNYFTVVCYAGFSLLFGYADTINFQIPLVLLEGFSGEIQRASRWVAVSNQLGSLVGAMIGFALTQTVFK